MKKTLIVMLILLAPLAASLSVALSEKQATVSVPTTVHYGQTLWGICERVADEYNDTRDLREIVYETAAHNGIKGGMLYAGQKIEVRVMKRQADKLREFSEKFFLKGRCEQ